MQKIEDTDLDTADLATLLKLRKTVKDRYAHITNARFEPKANTSDEISRLKNVKSLIDDTITELSRRQHASASSDVLSELAAIETAAGNARSAVAAQQRAMSLVAPVPEVYDEEVERELFGDLQSLH